ncbi:MAG: hypothetical protein IT581_14615 [Verrucomicrobiales bacterium]|nr:hypothetical protein [Verrucomicrobiales bacterium]
MPRRFPRSLLATGLALVLRGLVPENWAAEPGLGIERSGDAVQLNLIGDNGAVYSLEAVEAFLNGASADTNAWRPVATVAPRTTPFSLFDPICSTKPQNFYRLRVLQNIHPVEVANFRLLDLAGSAHELFYQSDAKAVVLVLAGRDVDSLKDQVPALQRLVTQYGPQGVRFWTLLTATESGPAAAARAAQWKSQAATLGLTTEILVDDGGAVTREFRPSNVPEAVVLDPAAWAIRYRGRISDVITQSAVKTEQPLLATALKELLAGDKVSVPFTLSTGTAADLADYSGASYARDIAPLFQQHCVRCHSPGNIAPWAMTNHTVIQERGALIKDELLSRRMPPWHADRQTQTYSNDEMLSGEDLAKLANWLNRGAPRGDGPDPLAASVTPPPPDWPLGTPDKIVAVDRQSIPATGTVDYRYLVVRNPFPNDVWLRAAVVKPGNRRVLHHVLIFGATSFTDILQIQAGLGGYFAAYVPGMEQVAFPEGTGKLLKRGAFLVFQVHYTATGQPETDATELGLYVAPQKPGRELNTAAAYNTLFSIPPGSEDFPATAEFVLPKNGTLYEFSPHMHYRGKWFRFEAITPDGQRETLLHVPFYRFDWQTLYRLQEPRKLAAGTRIVVTGGWDNSSKNPYNPDPSASVRFGEQSWEEMFIGYFNWAPE